MRRNILNVEDIEFFLRCQVSPNDFHKMRGSKSKRKMLEDYLVLALRNAIIKEDAFFKPVEDYPKNPPAWLTPEKFATGDFEQFETITDPNMYTSLHAVKKWIKDSILLELPWTKDLDEYGRPKALVNIGSFSNAVRKAKKTLDKQSYKLSRYFYETTGGIDAAVESGGIEIAHTFKDGYVMARLLTLESAVSEGHIMQHCLADMEEEDFDVEDTTTLSLRKRTNYSYVTVEVVGNRVTMCRGRQNAPPAEKYMKYIEKFIRDNGYELSEDLSNTGILLSDDLYYAVRNLPDNFQSPSAMLLSHAKWLRGLNDGLTVTGSLALDGCVNLRSLPLNLTVCGSLDLNNCPKLSLDKEVVETMYVEGDIYWNKNVYKSVPEFYKDFVNHREAQISVESQRPYLSGRGRAPRKDFE